MISLIFGSVEAGFDYYSLMSSSFSSFGYFELCVFVYL